MDLPISIPTDGQTKQVIQASIKQKLSEITGSPPDDVLPEYVMVMVANHKSKSQVAQDLDAFLGAEQSSTFTNWLWDALHAMNSDNARKAEPAKRPLKVEEDRDSRREPSPERSVFASVVTVPQTAERQRTTLDNPAPSRLILNAVQDAVRSTSGPASRSVELMRERDEEQERARERDRDHNQRDKRNNGRDREDRRDYNGRDYNGRDREDRRDYNGRERGRGDRDNRPREGVFDRLGSRDRDSEMEDARDTRGRGRQQRSRDSDSPLASRLGSISSASTSTNNNTADTKSNVFLPDTAAIHTRKEGGSEDNPVTFTVTLNGMKEDEVDSKPTNRNKRRSFDPADNEEEEATVEGGGKKLKKEKCTFFPNCKRGDECVYFHPTQMCKSFPECTYGENCMFIHPVIPCKFGAKCTRTNCAFSHVAHAPKAKAPSVNTALPTPRNAPSTTTFFPPPFANGGTKPCKHGFACPREGCSFFHPPNACVYGDACARPGCTFAHGKPCRSGVACTTPGCSFVHVQPLKTLCKFGAGCLNTSCRFSHDAPAANLKASDASMADAEDTAAISATLPPTPPTVTAS